MDIFLFLLVVLFVALIVAHIFEAYNYSRFVAAVHTFNHTAELTREAFQALATTVNDNADALEEVANEVERLTKLSVIKRASKNIKPELEA
jgi:hypothetical protein